MKYLIIATVVALVVVVVYSRLRPYIQLVRKVVRSLDVSASTNDSPRTHASPSSKLVHCAGCGTWIPEDRALHLKSGKTQYCSVECLEKKAVTKEQKLAG